MKKIIASIFILFLLGMNIYSQYSDIGELHLHSSKRKKLQSLRVLRIKNNVDLEKLMGFILELKEVKNL